MLATCFSMGHAIVNNLNGFLPLWWNSMEHVMSTFVYCHGDLPRDDTWNNFDHFKQLSMTHFLVMTPATIKRWLHSIMSQHLLQWLLLQTTPCQDRITAPVTQPWAQITPSMSLNIHDIQKESVCHGSYIVVACMVIKFLNTFKFVGDVLWVSVLCCSVSMGQLINLLSCMLIGNHEQCIS